MNVAALTPWLIACLAAFTAALSIDLARLYRENRRLRRELEASNRAGDLLCSELAHVRLLRRNVGKLVDRARREAEGRVN